MRLRILDLNTPWFWLTLFFNRPSYGKPKLELSLWGPHKWRNWWLYMWQWENLRSEQGSYAVTQRGAAEEAGPKYSAASELDADQWDADFRRDREGK